MTAPLVLLPQVGCFADTGFFYALRDEGDRWHDACVALFDQLQVYRRILVTTNFVVAEAHALMLQRLGWEAAFTIAPVNPTSVTILGVKKAMFKEACDDADGLSGQSPQVRRQH